jgi:hypothetical protein
MRTNFTTAEHGMLVEAELCRSFQQLQIDLFLYTAS